MKYLLVLLVIALTGCNSRGVDYVKTRAADTFAAQGFRIVGYQGYKYSPIGGCVWYTLRHVPDNGITYEACLLKWGDEIHVYSLRAIDAIKPE